MRKHRFFNMYLTTTISVALVLTLIGVEVVMLLSARNLINNIRENVSLTVVLTDNPDSAEVARLSNLLQIAPFAKQSRYVSKDAALDEHIRNLGEDPTDFLGYNPLHASFEVGLQAQYAHSDSIALIESKLQSFDSIEQIIYPRDIVGMLDKNVERLSVIVLGVAVILLFVAIALIVNTIRLQIYSKRFLINTMRLVGARSWTIKRPIIGRSIRMGIVAAIIALLLLAVAWYYCKSQLGIVILIPTWQNIAIVAGSVFLCAIILTWLAASFAAGRYIRMRTNDLYYI